MTTFDPTKPVQTRDGRKARIICTDRKHDNFPIMALIQTDSGTESHESYTKDGFCLINRAEYHLDLINVPEKIEGWINIYPSILVGPYNSKEYAKRVAGSDLIACIHISFTKGEGLS